MLNASTVVYCPWHVATLGYQWRSARKVTDSWSVGKGSEPVLVSSTFPNEMFGIGPKPVEYEPLDTSGLFQELAAVEPSPAGIQAFANRFGALTRGRLFAADGNVGLRPTPNSNVRPSHFYDRPDSPEGKEALTIMASWAARGAVLGDSLAYWREEIRVLRALISLWEALRTPANRIGIEKYAQFEWQDNKRTIKLIDAEGKQVAPALRFDVPSSVKLTLAGAAERGLFQALTKLTFNGSGVSLFPPGSRHSRKLAIVPKTLRDAIWLQFALAVLDNKKYRACEVCGKSFEVSPQVARTTRTLCSSACKQKAHRLRRDQAFKLAEEGLTAKQIAKRVGSQLSTVENWLQEFKEKH